MIPLDEIDFIGTGLNRPECVLSTSNGRLYASDWRGGVSIMESDGLIWSVLAKNSKITVKPNGICLMEDGSFLLAHLGDAEGGVYRLSADGVLTSFCTEIDGVPMPPTNYPHLDVKGRVWITVSTRQTPRARSYRPDVADGFIVLVDNSGARIVADNLGYTNECLVHPDGRRLFVNETFARRLTSFDINEDGSLSNKTTVANFNAGTYPDGMTFDQDGGIWITSIVSNRVIRISPDGRQEIIVEDNDPSHLQWVEEAFLAGTMNRPHLDQIKSEKLRNISSLAFGGPDLKSIYLGCLLGDQIGHFRSPLAGHPPTHWNFAGPSRIYS
jgi:sugar lactone lactonase YvrE